MGWIGSGGSHSGAMPLLRLWGGAGPQRKARLVDRTAAPQAPTAEALQHRYLDVVYRFVARRLKGEVEREDITAEVFAAAFGALHRCPPLPPCDAESADDPVRAWLLTIARRKVTDVYRRRKRRPETPLDDLTEGILSAVADPAQRPEERALQAERATVLRQILAGLPEDSREALLLKYVDGLSQAEIATILGRSVGAVNSLLQRARMNVWKRGRGYFGEEEDLS